MRTLRFGLSIALASAILMGLVRCNSKKSDPQPPATTTSGTTTSGTTTSGTTTSGTTTSGTTTSGTTTSGTTSIFATAELSGKVLNFTAVSTNAFAGSVTISSNGTYTLTNSAGVNIDNTGTASTSSGTWSYNEGTGKLTLTSGSNSLVIDLEKGSTNSATYQPTGKTSPITSNFTISSPARQGK